MYSKLDISKLCEFCIRSCDRFAVIVIVVVVIVVIVIVVVVVVIVVVLVVVVVFVIVVVVVVVWSGLVWSEEHDIYWNQCSISVYILA